METRCCVFCREGQQYRSSGRVVFEGTVAAGVADERRRLCGTAVAKALRTHAHNAYTNGFHLAARLICIPLPRERERY